MVKAANAIAIQTAIRAIVVNAFLAVLKIVTGVIGSSYALVADGIESLNDIISSSAVLVSLKISAKPPDDNHPYGHGKAEQLGALFSAISLLVAGGVIAWQSGQNLFGRHTSPAWYTLVVLVLVIILKELFSRYMLRKSRETSSAALRGEAWHHRSDAITSAAAFLGILIALIGGPGYEKADDIAALIGCVIIGYNGFKLLSTALHESMDGAPDKELLLQAQHVAEGVDQVLRIEKLRMKKIGLGYFMDIHIQVDSSLTVLEGHHISHQVKDALLQEIPLIQDVVTHIEPYKG
jgi:cation diffusion facilitator family transporter